MRRMCLWDRVLLVTLLFALVFSVAALPHSQAFAEAAEGDMAEWTVMLYLCGADLESESGSATANLAGVAQASPVPEVNFIVQTGGAREWHAEELGMEVDPTKLERWSYTDAGFQKVGEAPLASMGERSTLADFLTWTQENYPAKKYQLILWDHGGASINGVVFDELFKNGSLQLFDLAGALKDSGIQLETFMTDTCLMATLETAEAVAPYAKYFVGCEESLANEGTNYAGYMQYLYDDPDCDGVQFGKRICSETEAMYSDKNALNDLGFLTISLIDLSKVRQVREAFDGFITEVAELLDDPAAFYEYCYATRNRESYVYTDFVDIYDLARRASGHGVSPRTAAKLQDAVEDAVLFNVSGNNHIRSHGMTVYYALKEDQYRLDHFSRVCSDPVYLAFLDRINYKWKAPDWVYETVERKGDIRYEDYKVDYSVEVSEDGKEAYLEMNYPDYCILEASWELLTYDPNTELWRSYGRDPSFIEGVGEHTILWKSTFDGTWPALGGVPLTMNISDEQEDYTLYTTPMKVDDIFDNFRILYRYEEEGAPELELIGSSPMDDHTGYPDRNTFPVEYGSDVEPMGTLVNLLDNTRMNYKVAEPFLYEQDMGITREPLPAGEYALRFIIKDIFGNEIRSSSLVACEWDGESVTFMM